MENQTEQELPKKSKKWIIILPIIILLVIGVVAIVVKSKNGKPANSLEDIEKLKSSVRKDLTYAQVVSDPEKYKGAVVQWGAKVFTQPEKDEKGIYFQAFEGGDDNNFAVAYADPNFQIKEDDFAIITGEITGKFKGTNAFGAKLEIPAIKALHIEAGTRNNVVAPANVVIPVNDSVVQNDFTVVLEKIELAEKETRFFIKVKNDSKEAVNFYDYDSKLTQGSKQYDTESVDSSQELPSEILSGIEAEGVIVFPAINREQKQLTVHLDKPGSSNYSLDWKEVKFDVVMP